RVVLVSASCQSPHRARRRTHALNRRDHFQHASSGSHFVHPEHGSPVCGRQGGRGQGAFQAFGQTHTQSFPDEVFVAQCHQDGPSSVNKVFYVAQQTKTGVR